MVGSNRNTPALRVRVSNIQRSSPHLFPRLFVDKVYPGPANANTRMVILHPPSLAGDLVDRFGQTLDVPCRDAGHGNSAVFRCVDRMLDSCISQDLPPRDLLSILPLSLTDPFVGGLNRCMRTYQSRRLSDRQGAGVQTVSYLRSDVAPVVLAAKLLEVFFQQRPHADDSVCHALDLAQPLFIQRGVIQDFCGYTSTVHWRIRVEWSHEDLQLRVYPLLLFGRLAHNRESSDTLTI